MRQTFHGWATQTGEVQARGSVKEPRPFLSHSSKSSCTASAQFRIPQPAANVQPLYVHLSLLLTVLVRWVFTLSRESGVPTAVSPSLLPTYIHTVLLPTHCSPLPYPLPVV